VSGLVGVGGGLLEGSSFIDQIMEDENIDKEDEESNH